MKHITRYRGVILSRNKCRKIGWNAFGKKKRLCPVSFATARRKKPKKSFSSDWTENLAEAPRVIRALTSTRSNGWKSWTSSPNAECDPLVFTWTFCASRSKITVEEPLQIKFAKYKRTWFHMDVSVPEQSCPLHETNLPTTKKSRAFTINLTSVPGFRAIGGGHAAASKVFSFLRLSPINKNSRAEQICIPTEKQCIPTTHRVKIWPAAYHLWNAYCYCKMIPLW